MRAMNWRAALWVGVAVAGVLLLLLTATAVVFFFRGVAVADADITQEINVLQRTETEVLDYRQQHGALPPPLSDIYEHGLAAGNWTDSTVEYYSGYQGNHFLILHLRSDGAITVSRR